jgi:hypothetical protein
MWLAVLAALVVGVAHPDEALARRKGQKIKAKVNGKRFKGNVKEAIVGVYDANSKVLTLNAIYQKIRPRKGAIKIFTTSVNVDLGAAGLPVTTPAFFTTYSDTVFTGPVAPGAPTTWAGEGLTVTITDYDGARVKGTFEGSLEPGTPDAEGPATFSKGKFQVDLLPF